MWIFSRSHFSVQCTIKQDLFSLVILMLTKKLGIERNLHKLKKSFFFLWRKLNFEIKTQNCKTKGFLLFKCLKNYVFFVFIVMIFWTGFHRCVHVSARFSLNCSSWYPLPVSESSEVSVRFVCWVNLCLPRAKFKQTQSSRSVSLSVLLRSSAALWKSLTSYGLSR